MAKNETSTVKKTGITVLTLICLACLVIVFWWGWVQLYAPNKVVYNTHNVGQIETVDGKNVKTVVEVKYHSNDNKNGLEMLDIKFNEFSDESKKMFYSQGLQFVADTPNGSLDWGVTLLKTPRPLVFSSNHWWGSYNRLENGSIHMYASADDYKTTLTDSQALDFNSDFKIELHNEEGTTDLYLMEFKGTNTKRSEAYEIATAGSSALATKINVYSYSDPYLFSKRIYDMVQGLANGTSQNIAFKFNDMFNFKNYDNGVYLSEEARETNKIDIRVNDYCVIKVEISADGARQATDSLFNNIKGSSNFSLTGDYEEDDYYFGRSTIICTNQNFDIVVIEDNKVALKLKQEFIDKTKPYKDKIELLIDINVAQLEEQGYEYIGFTKDSGLENFVIQEIVATEDSEVA